MLGRHIFGYLPVNAVQGLVALGTIAIFTRLLSPDEYGRYAMVLAAVQLIQGACFYWLHASAGRFHESAVRDGRLAQHLSTGYAGFAATALVVTAVYVPATFLLPLPAAMTAALLAGLGCLLPRSALMVSLENHRAAQRIGPFSRLEMIQGIVGLALGAALAAWTDMGAAAPLLGLALGSLACIAVDHRSIAAAAIRFVPSRQELATFARYGVPLSLSMIVELLLATSDRFLISYFIGDAAVGVYAAGYALADRTLSILFSTVTVAAVPLTFAALEREGVQAARQLCRRNAETMLFLALPAAAGLALVAEPIAAVMVGAELRAEAAAIVPWMALAGLLRGVTLHYIHHAFLLARRTDLLIWLMTGPMVLNMALNLVLLRRFGLEGTIASIVLSYAVALIACTVIGRRLFPLPLAWDALAKGLLATGAMALAVGSLPDLPGIVGLVVPVTVGMTSYGVAAVALDLLESRGRLAAMARRLVRAG